ncbi:MAG: hypothetical protein D6732_03020 [Methanobacteriota archaeon]|nr:MAG: hypothetical protein D6732_03020 [Euryarchaeota archaeon]
MEGIEQDLIILPCSLCGHKGVIVRNEAGSCVVCDYCLMSGERIGDGSIEENDKMAIQTWNARYEQNTAQ